MITLLVVGPAREGEPEAPPSVEVLRAKSPDQAIETLSRNRRIDAVLFIDEDAARGTVLLMAEEGASWPPLFQAGKASAPGIVPLEPESALSDLLGHLL